MFKIITMSKRKHGMTQQQFAKYWHEVHGAIILGKVPANMMVKIKKYAQCPAVDIPGHPQPYDGVAEFCFDDMESLRAWSKFYFSDEAKVLRDDQAKFIDMSSVVTVVTEERVIVPK
ncbi:MAG: EthD domain-containing protein [Dehalococcoidia bacterium]|jgi:uncharacterized protein (TIGR02118 family)